MCNMICRMIEDKEDWGSDQQQKQFRRLSVHMRRHLPPRDWMLGLLSKMHPDNEIFKKGYHPPKKERAQQVQPTIPNHNGFFDNLPPLSASELRKGNGFKLNLLTKKQRKQQQLE